MTNDNPKQEEMAEKAKKRYKQPPLVSKTQIERVVDRYMPIREETVFVRENKPLKQMLFEELSKLIIDAGGKAPGYHRRLMQILEKHNI